MSGITIKVKIPGSSWDFCLTELAGFSAAIVAAKRRRKGEEIVFEKLVEYIRHEPQRWDGERLNRILTLAIHSLSERVKACREIERVTNTIV